MMTRRALALLVLGGVGACGPEPAPPHADEPAPPAETCELEIQVRVRDAGSGFEVAAWAINRGRAPVRLALPAACPGGPIRFGGLPGGYDYYRTCNMGACIEPGSPTPIELAFGEQRALASIQVDPASGTCNAALPEGIYTVTADPPPTSAATCVTPGRLVVPPARRHAEPTPPPASPRRARPARERCPPMPACGLACPDSGFAQDENGCTLCACAPSPFE